MDNANVAPLKDTRQSKLAHYWRSTLISQDSLGYAVGIPGDNVVSTRFSMYGNRFKQAI